MFAFFIEFNREVVYMRTLASSPKKVQRGGRVINLLLAASLVFVMLTVFGPLWKLEMLISDIRAYRNLE